MNKTVLTVFLGLILATGGYAQSRLAMPNDPNANPRSGQSEIIFNAENSDKDIAVWVNNAIVAHIFPKTSEKIIIGNGRNIIEAAETTLKGGQWSIGERKQIVVDANSGRISISLTTRYGRLLSLNMQGGVAVAPAAIQPAAQPVRPAAKAAASDNSIENAINRAVQSLVADIPEGETLAIISISAADSDLAEFVIEELVYFIVDTKRFKVVDRKSLDVIRTEHKFQYSGDVDDDSAVSIGKMLGASIVITGSISGSGATRRLRAKALNVKTAQILAMASERF